MARDDLARLCRDLSQQHRALAWGAPAEPRARTAELRVSADAELRVDGLDVVSTLEDLESRLSTIEGLCVNDTAVEDDGL